MIIVFKKSITFLLICCRWIGGRLALQSGNTGDSATKC